MRLKRSSKILIFLCFFNLLTVGVTGCGKDKPPVSANPISPSPNPTSPSPNPTSPSPALKVYQFQISRYITASLDEARADVILKDGSAVLQAKDGPEDMVCPVELRRAGGVTVFTTGNGAVNSEADYKAILALPGQIKVVNQINWCGAFTPNIIGCAPTPGSSLIVVRDTPSQEGILWDHEFGHNKGLVHRSESTAMMNAVIGADHGVLNEAESKAIQE